MARIGLLTGPIGVGKTTVAADVVRLARQQGLVCGGLLAPAMKDHSSQKVGIWGVDIQNGERRVLARTDCDLAGPSVGCYHFDEPALDWAITVIERAIGRCDLLIVDEIGKLELWQGVGLAPVLSWLTDDQIRRALIVVRDSLLIELRARLGCLEQVEFWVTEQNRGELASFILNKLV